MPSSTNRPVESTTATTKRGLWVPPDELGDDPDTCDWALDDLPTSAARRGAWLLAGGVVLGVPVILAVGLLSVLTTGGVLAYTLLGDAPPRATITSAP